MESWSNFQIQVFIYSFEEEVARIVFIYFNKIYNRFKFLTSFSSLTLHAVNILLWKKILSLTLFTLSHQPTLSGFSLWRDQHVPPREGTSGQSPCKSKSLNFPLLLDITPIKKSSSPVSLMITDHILGKKVSPIAFRQILPKILHSVTQSWLIWKSPMESSLLRYYATFNFWKT